MLMINCLTLLIVSEILSHTFFNFKGDSVEWTNTVLLIYGQTIFIENLVGPKTLEDVQSLSHTMVRCWNNGIWSNFFSCKLDAYHLSPCFHVFSDCGVSVSDIVCVGDGVSIYDWNSSFQEKNAHVFITISCQFKCYKYFFQD